PGRFVAHIVLVERGSPRSLGAGVDAVVTGRRSRRPVGNVRSDVGEEGLVRIIGGGVLDEGGQLVRDDVDPVVRRRAAVMNGRAVVVDVVVVLGVRASAVGAEPTGPAGWDVRAA